MTVARELPDLLGEFQVGLREGRFDRRLHEALLEGVAVVDDLDAAPGSVTEESRAAMFAGITTAASTSPELTARTACARVATGTGCTWLKSCAVVVADVRARSPPSSTVGPGRREVDDRDLRLGGRARDRQPDQQRDRDRVDHQHRHQHARAAQDQQVLAAAATATSVAPLAQERARRPLSKSRWASFDPPLRRAGGPRPELPAESR